MTLAEYRKVCGVSFTFIARKCGCSIAAISQIASNKMKPTFELAIKIEAATGGNVSREIWYPSKPAQASIMIGEVQ